MNFSSDEVGLLPEDPILYHPAVVHQQFHQQLGASPALYPGGTHTRLHHLAHATLIMTYLCQMLSRKGRLFFPPNDGIVAAKLHDASHPTFSHVLDYLLACTTGKDHNARAVELIDSPITDSQGRTLEQVIREAEHADPERVKSILSKKDPASAIVKLADLFAYTHLDSARCGFTQTPPDWRALADCFTYFQAGVGIDVSARAQQESILNTVCSFQQVLRRLYEEVYISPLNLAYQRKLQKAGEFALAEGLFSPEELYTMPDQVFLWRIRESKETSNRLRLAREFVNRYIERRPYQSAITYRINAHAHKDEIPLEHARAASIIKHLTDPREATKIEDALEQKHGIPFLITAVPDPTKLEPADYPVYKNGEKIGMLRDIRPHHFAAQREAAHQYFHIDLCVPPEHASTAERNSKEINNTALELFDQKISQNKTPQDKKTA